MKINNLELLNQVNLLRQDVSDLTIKIDEWNSDDFYKEQHAREKLQMAHVNEEIYYKE